MGSAHDGDGSSVDVVRHPDSARLVQECELLHAELVSLVVELEHLLHVVRPSLEALYLVNLGPLKHELLTLPVTNRRMVRRLELMRAASPEQATDWVGTAPAGLPAVDGKL